MTGNKNAFPNTEYIDNADGTKFVPFVSGGLTKRELFAAMAMQGALSGLAHSNDERITDAIIAKRSVIAADALLAELAKPKKEP